MSSLVNELEKPTLWRCADDFVVMCRKDVEEPLKAVRHVLKRLGLSLN